MDKFNEYQSSLEELDLDSYPKEVVENFYDCLTNIPFIKHLSSVDRKRACDLERDSEGKIIINIENPHILENMDYFRPSAIHYQKYGCYTKLRPNPNPNSEFGKWITEEVRRCWNGYVRESDGEWITGDLYFYLNYCPIQLIKTMPDGSSVRTVDFPVIWDGQYLISHYLNRARRSGHHASELASRGKGKSFFGGAMLAKRFLLGESSNVRKKVLSLVTASDRKYIYGPNQILNMFKYYIDHCAKTTQFPNKRLTDSAQALMWESGYKDKDTGVRHGTENAVVGISAGVNQDKLNGSRGVLYLIEEAGIFSNLNNLYQMIRPSVEDGSAVYGLIFMYGTAGDDMSDFTTLQEIMYNPDGYNMEKLKNVYDKDGQGKRDFTFFFPAYLNRAKCYDSNGNSNVTKALLELLMDRYVVKYNSTDINAITKRISQYPITPQEAIVRTSSSIFPITELIERINQIDNNPAFYNQTYVGDLILNSNNEIEFQINNKQPIRHFPTKDNKVEGSLEFHVLPQKDSNGKVPPERYIMGADPYDDDTSNTMSLGSVLVLDLWTDTIVAEYTGRPAYADDYYEICRKLCIFYNAKLMYENNKKGLFSYFSRLYCTHLLADTPEYLRDKQLIKDTGYGNKAKGIVATNGIKAYGYRLIRDWLLKSIPIIEKDEEGNEHETTIFNLYNIKNRALLEELSKWNPDINVDRIMALVQLMLYREEKMVLYGGDLSKSERIDPNGLENDEFFIENYDNRFGINNQINMSMYEEKR